MTSALTLANLKFRCISDPLVHHGRHFGRTIQAMCNVEALILNGLVRLGDLSGEPEESFPATYVMPLLRFIINLYFSFYSQRREFRIFKNLLRMSPGLEERLLEGNKVDALYVAELVSVVLVLQFYILTP